MSELFVDPKEIERLSQSLKRIYDEEKYRIVFWYDAEQEFYNVLGYLELENVIIVNLDNTPSFGLKVQLEIEDTAST